MNYNRIIMIIMSNIIVSTYIIHTNIINIINDIKKQK